MLPPAGVLAQYLGRREGRQGLRAPQIRVPIQTLGFKRGLTEWYFNVQRRVQRLQETSRWASAQPDYEVFQTSRAGVLAELPAFDLGLGLGVRPSLVGGFERAGPG